MATSAYPLTYRRLRTSSHIRALAASVRLTHHGFIQPLFIEQDLLQPRAVNGLAHIQVDTIETIISTIDSDLQAGISKFLIFPIPSTQTAAAFDFSFAVRVVAQIKKHFGKSVWIAADLCLCSYTDHGHCGILSEDHQQLLNAETVSVLRDYACQLAQVGVDCIAPSDMMDGRIAAIRTALNMGGFEQVTIMSYAAKFTSQFYGPFRDACKSAPKTNGLRDRRSYQISSANPNDAIRSARRDEEEGADILMVKPAVAYTDIIGMLKENTSSPIAAYHVSGEYASVEALVEKGLADRAAVHLEIWTALQRSGADIIISYAARHAKQWIEKIEW